MSLQSGPLRAEGRWRSGDRHVGRCARRAETTRTDAQAHASGSRRSAPSLPVAADNESSLTCIHLHSRSPYR